MEIRSTITMKIGNENSVHNIVFNVYEPFQEKTPPYKR